ncbi:hypothetical protein BDA99DRAFT_518601 [Phascolomyces articulosus]|uniref:Uncharacterized protein n=1 Tax=Phascolomyces articulosus TaxID=60185 RepID=A0AAD5JUG8_9FUNG|nr:hypothetical protein BDA99DRAFT_518601 [Phascolomyces articulosus]
MTYSTTTQHHQQLEPCLARLGTMPEDKPSFVKQVNAVEDIETLRRLLIEKERERTSIANDLDVAARLGLVISETNEAIKIKLAHLEQENELLRQELTRTHTSSNHNDLTRDSTTSPPPDDHYAYHHHHHHDNHQHHHQNHHHDNHDHDIIDPNDERIYLTQELEQARRDLSKFRREMDGLSGQLNDMASEMVDSRARVSMYAKRLAEVEHKLSTTREMNVNLQALLERALTSQKQSSSNTSHLVRNIQTDLTRVVTENDQLRARIADLESQQVESEERLADMVGQAKKYASLLEQAQDTIHGLSEPRLSDDDTFSNGDVSVSSSYWEGGKETEITKGSAFSVEFRQEMQKEIERNLNLRNEIRHRIITHESISSDKKKTQEGLKYLLSDRSADGLMSVSTSTSTTSSSTTTTTNTATKQSQHHYLHPSSQAIPSFSISQHQVYHSNGDHNQQQQSQEPASSSSMANTTTASSSSSSTTATTTNPATPLPQTQLRPASFLTGFGGFGSDNSVGPTSFITRGTTFAASRGTGDMPSISTRFFQRLATRFDEQHKIENKRIN